MKKMMLMMVALKLEPFFYRDLEILKSYNTMKLLKSSTANRAFSEVMSHRRLGRPLLGK